ncbi:MAG TPA: FAD-dependent monooxygenase, partial [Acidimicrobiia bacterium]
TVDAASRSDGGAGSHPVIATLERVDSEQQGEVVTVRARYVVGCDGAHSTVRHAIGLSMQGDSANQAWGVMDVLAVTSFPDIRLKTLIRSANHGSLLIIPREGGYLTRVYIELARLSPGERVADLGITVEGVIDAARMVFRPYPFDVKEVAWWSVYEIGQRLCDRFDDVGHDVSGTRMPRVFVVGDACHTHSPKAGQGMNVAIRDAFNLGWKLAAVLRGQSSPEILHTYSDERHAVAKELIDFDRVFAEMMGAPPKTEAEPDGVDPVEFEHYFARQGRYTAGTTIRYDPSVLTSASSHLDLVEGFPIGMRFHSAPVIRLADAKPVELGHVIKADGRWRLMVFGDRDDPASPGSAMAQLCGWLADGIDSPVRRYGPPNADIDSVIDVRAVFQQNHRTLALEAMPSLLLPRKGRLGLRDYEKMFCADSRDDRDIFDLRGIDRDRGCVVVVRPDQHVSHVLALDAHAELAAFFDAFMIDQS